MNMMTMPIEVGRFVKYMEVRQSGDAAALIGLPEVAVSSRRCR